MFKKIIFISLLITFGFSCWAQEQDSMMVPVMSSNLDYSRTAEKPYSKAFFGIGFDMNLSRGGFTYTAPISVRIRPLRSDFNILLEGQWSIHLGGSDSLPHYNPTYDIDMMDPYFSYMQWSLEATPRWNFSRQDEIGGRWYLGAGLRMNYDYRGRAHLNPPHYSAQGLYSFQWNYHSYRFDEIIKPFNLETKIEIGYANAFMDCGFYVRYLATPVYTEAATPSQLYYDPRMEDMTAYSSNPNTPENPDRYWHINPSNFQNVVNDASARFFYGFVFRWYFLAANTK